jgi:hypothetical protein
MFRDPDCNVNTMWEFFKQTLSKSAKQHIPQNNSKDKDRQPWINRDKGMIRGFGFSLTGLKSNSVYTISWSEIPGMVSVLSTFSGLLVSTKSSLFDIKKNLKRLHRLFKKKKKTGDHQTQEQYNNLKHHTQKITRQAYWK